MAQYKDNLIAQHMNSPFKEGEIIKFNMKHIQSNYSQKDKYALYKILKIDGNAVMLKSIDSSQSTVITDISTIEKNIINVGHDPFVNDPFFDLLVNRQYSIESILFTLGKSDRTHDLIDNNILGHIIPESTDDPYVVDKNGQKIYYQRGYVWDLKDEQQFIDSIYNNIDCGKIIARQRSYNYVYDKAKKGEVENLAFRDIVDGKQRIHALTRFINDEFPDSYGYYYSDLSARARKIFQNRMNIGYVEISADATDADIIKLFCMVNYTGKPQSPETFDALSKLEF